MSDPTQMRKFTCHFRVGSWYYPQTLDKAGKAFQRQTPTYYHHSYFTDIKKFYNICLMTEKLVREKRSSLFSLFISDGEKKFNKPDTWSVFHKHVMRVTYCPSKISCTVHPLLAGCRFPKGTTLFFNSLTKSNVIWPNVNAPDKPKNSEHTQILIDSCLTFDYHY
jgi:hypothetical protein